MKWHTEPLFVEGTDWMNRHKGIRSDPVHTVWDAGLYTTALSGWIIAAAIQMA